MNKTSRFSQIKIRLIQSLFFLGAVLMMTAPSYAEVVNKILPNGQICLDSGACVELAGVEPLPEGRSVLAALLAGKTVELESAAFAEDPEIAVSEKVPANEKRVYLYTMASELPAPFVKDESPRSQRVLVNEILLQMGAAQIRKGEVHPLSAQFLSAQDTAKTSGQGVWSYEPISPKSKRTRKSTAEETPTP